MILYKVSEVAELAGISVRTLHHYDSIGLLQPESIGENGYRLYSEGDLARLQQIMFLKELDFPLKDIGRMIDNPRFSGAEALQKQRDLLLKKRKRLDRIIETIDISIASQREGIPMDKKKMFEAFDMKEIEEQVKNYGAEAEERWGRSDAWKESRKRTSRYSEKEWAAIKAEEDHIYRSLGASMTLEPDDPAVQALVARWQSHLTKWFYECTPEILAGLGEMYVLDQRFAENIDRYGKGLAVFFRDAIRVYCS